MKQKQQLVLKQDVVNGFSLSFTKALLTKLKELKKENRIIIENRRYDFIPITHVIFSQLNDQLGNPSLGCNTREEEVEELIKAGEEFCRIFEEKK
ncbi:MAG: hypothetical protein HYW34_01785 [Candidatus Brennerbacteria bacterium]|nr:hypothetical protein [Candidatus Brennerbacteria bacterium]